jgi:DNA mismatch endonuclease (patch repair protein)
VRLAFTFPRRCSLPITHGKRLTVRNAAVSSSLPAIVTSRDVVSPQRRSQIMAGIGRRNTAPEKLVRSLLHRLGYRFRLHARSLPGRPDIVLRRYRLAVFVHGCYWHLHRGCPAGRLPTGNREFWRKKLTGNRARDRRNERELIAAGWRVVTIWECEIERSPSIVANRLNAALGRSHSARRGRAFED